MWLMSLTFSHISAFMLGKDRKWAKRKTIALFLDLAGSGICLYRAPCEEFRRRCGLRFSFRTKNPYWRRSRRLSNTLLPFKDLIKNEEHTGPYRRMKRINKHRKNIKPFTFKALNHNHGKKFEKFRSWLDEIAVDASASYRRPCSAETESSGHADCPRPKRYRCQIITARVFGSPERALETSRESEL